MKIGVTGIKGKMGRAIASLVLQDPITELQSALVRKGDSLVGDDLGEFLGFTKSNTQITDNIEEFVKSCDAVIDFSGPALSLDVANLCGKNKKVIVSGTTGFTEKEKQEFVSNSKSTALIWSSNMSLGVNLLFNLVEQVANILHDDFDAEIIEMHHNKKVDSPSGTALSLGAAIAKGRGVDLEEYAKTSRVGKNVKRKRGEIGFASIRAGDIVGDHKVIFAGDGEIIELSHKALERDIFAKGAVRAAIWGSVQKPGMYSMRDVLK